MKGWFVVIVMLFSASMVGASDLSDYPFPFVVNGIMTSKLVVGQNAATSDVIGAIDVAASLIALSKTDISLGRIGNLFDSHMGVLDVDAPRMGSENLIVIGGPCANSVAAKLLEYPIPCHKGFEPGKAMIKYFPKQRALLLAGYSAQDTLAASYVLSDYKDYTLKGEEMVITVVGLDLLTLNPVVT